MSIWIVYDADRLIVGVFGTAADAAAWVAAGTGLTATAGLTSASALAAQPGQFYLTNRTITSDKPLSDVEELQQRVWQVHAHLINLWGLLQIEAAAHPWSEMIKVHDYFARIHPSLYHLLKTNVPQCGRWRNASSTRPPCSPGRSTPDRQLFPRCCSPPLPPRPP